MNHKIQGISLFLLSGDLFCEPKVDLYERRTSGQLNVIP